MRRITAVAHTANTVFTSPVVGQAVTGDRVLMIGAGLTEAHC